MIGAGIFLKIHRGATAADPLVKGPSVKNFKGKFGPITWDELYSGKEIPKTILTAMVKAAA